MVINRMHLTINKEGKIQNLKGTLIDTPELSEYFLNLCSKKGVTVKYNSDVILKLHLVKSKNSLTLL